MGEGSSISTWHVLVVGLLVCTTHFAQDSGLENLNELLEPLREKADVPSLAAVALVDGELHSAGAVGVRKKGGKDAVTIQDKYHIGSCTKSMTATLAAALIEEGKIEWDSTIGEVLKRYRPREEFKEVTLRQLLSNRGGFPTRVPPPIWSGAQSRQGKPRQQRGVFVKSMLQVDPVYPPGKGDQYSNAGFAIAGHMLEETMRKPWEDLMQDRIFDPLGMKSAGFGGPNLDRRTPQPWGHTEKGRPIGPGPGADNPASIGPAGTVHCSLLDLARYVRMHLLSETGPVLKEAGAFAILHRPLDKDHGYAKGWLVAPRPWAGGDALTHSGSNTMFYLVIWVAPEKRFAGIAATNTGGGAGVCDEAVSAMIQRYLP